MVAPVVAGEVARRLIRWYRMDRPVEQLETDREHEITVQREALPLILVPGIMGSRLRQAGTGRVVWDPPDSKVALGLQLHHPDRR
jgi:hypothetical protein